MSSAASGVVAIRIACFELKDSFSDKATKILVEERNEVVNAIYKIDEYYTQLATRSQELRMAIRENRTRDVSIDEAREFASKFDTLAPEMETTVAKVRAFYFEYKNVISCVTAKPRNLQEIKDPDAKETMKKIDTICAEKGQEMTKQLKSLIMTNSLLEAMVGSTRQTATRYNDLLDFVEQMRKPFLSKL